jgi:hypothetical protein
LTGRLKFYYIKNKPLEDFRNTKNGFETEVGRAKMANLRLDRRRISNNFLDYKLVPFRISHTLGLLSHVGRVLPYY